MTEGLFPRAFIKREQTNLGEQWPAFEAAHMLPAPVSVRVNPAKSKIVPAIHRVPWSMYGFYLDNRPSFTLDPTFHGGRYYVQEASSMFLEQALAQLTDSTSSLTVLDVCAAPGGKSTHLLSLIGKNSLLVSNEVIPSRAAILSENIQKWGHGNVVVTNNDPKDFQRLPGFFDVILIDAPCSGEGLFRKDPNALREWSEEVVSFCSRRQRRILNDIWPALKTGGLMIYSTCTYSADENEENLKWLSRQYQVEPLALNVEHEWGVQTIEDESMSGYRFSPHRVKGEGFFLSAFRKLDQPPEHDLHSKTRIQAPGKKITDEIQQWVLKPEEKSFILHNDQVRLLPEKRMPELQSIVKNLRIMLAGTAMATIKHEKLIPEHAFALSVDINRDAFQVIALDQAQAIDYLRKDVLNLDLSKRGFALVSFDDVALGWVNILENRINNLYPSDWRIRMR
jgi:16S rRNA C967 or C1407 C5-methylase (RsmB/RsmF family)/NOL1/NOP2/fmu family ribosome biogenesis protein